MNLKKQIKGMVGGEPISPGMEFTLVFREIPKETGESGFVAECLEIPGCVSQGETQEEAEANVKQAVRACLSVMFEDCVREAASHRWATTSYVGISSQQRITVKANPDWELQSA